ncbi:hypothetical protein BCD67_00295 [Oscillatoriales cyanobacterium USR001]|nr:hypothetical protein BCD67_00295 [Oscillatoriales cyanobacterium USR001]
MWALIQQALLKKVPIRQLTIDQQTFERPTKPAVDLNSKPNFLAIPPKFWDGVKTEEYRISWRLVCDSGQDGSIIRPIIGAKGYPYYPGSSMKGAFRQACSEAQALEYCGGEVIENGEKKTKPGILRFHGAYPVDTSWTNCLVDPVHSQQNKQVFGPVHSQQNKQVIVDETTRANVQISLYRVKLNFGISSASLQPNDPKWDEIWEIWKKALSSGLGSRVSAGYGYFDLPNDISQPNELLHVTLKGSGLASTLLKRERPEDKTETPEFRPNMFKASLRGHTLRLLGGMIDDATAKYLAKILWGGFRDNYNGQLATCDDRRNNAIEGLLKVRFKGDLENAIELHEYKPKKEPGDKHEPKSQYTPVYQSAQGVLQILLSHPQIVEEHRQQLKKLATAIVQFAMLLGGFGKSWRRIDHCQFYGDYTSYKPPIGCHWEFATESESFYLPINDLKKDVNQFINNVRSYIKSWVSSQGITLSGFVAKDWREAWHLYKKNQYGVQVWGRISQNLESQAIHWFHGSYQGNDSIYKSGLTGKLNQTGRIWHRMYPQYNVDDKGQIQSTRNYVEFLTIFPGKTQTDGSDETSKFLTFLDKETDFQRLW